MESSSSKKYFGYYRLDLPALILTPINNTKMMDTNPENEQGNN